MPAWYPEGEEEAEGVRPARGQPWQGITGTKSLLRVYPPPPFAVRIGGLEEGVEVLHGFGWRRRRTMRTSSGLKVRGQR